jgi:hypothetical protein
VLRHNNSREGFVDHVGLHEEILHYTSSLPIRFLPAASLQDDLGRNWTKIVALDTRLLAWELGFGIYSLDSQDELVTRFSLRLQPEQVQIEEEKTIELHYSYRGQSHQSFATVFLVDVFLLKATNQRARA